MTRSNVKLSKGPVFWVYQSFDTILDSFKKRSISARLVFIFWCCGPFFFLWERTPADAWVSLLAITFAVRCVMLKQFAFLKAQWFGGCLLFLGVCVVSSLTSILPVYSLSEALIWFRFPLFAAAVVFWLADEEGMLMAFILSLGVSMIIMALINIAEIVYLWDLHSLKNWDGRLMWPYGDYFPGSFNAKLTLPISLALASVIFADKSGLKSAATAILLLVWVGVLMTGERINGLIFMSSCALVLVFSKPNVRTVTLACTFCLMVFVTVILINPVFLIKVKQLLQISFNSNNSNYHELIQNGWLIFLDNIWLGIGTANFRPLCPELVPMELVNGCNNHPHNYYVQVLAEVGLLGFFAFSLMWILLIKSCWESRHVENAFAKTAFIIPLAFFFPIQTSADLFSQWNNSVMWTALALALSTHKIGEMTAK